MVKKRNPEQIACFFEAFGCRNIKVAWDERAGWVIVSKRQRYSAKKQGLLKDFTIGDKGRIDVPMRCLKYCDNMAVCVETDAVDIFFGAVLDLQKIEDKSGQIIGRVIRAQWIGGIGSILDKIRGAGIMEHRFVGTDLFCHRVRGLLSDVVDTHPWAIWLGVVWDLSLECLFQGYSADGESRFPPPAGDGRKVLVRRVGFDCWCDGLVR